jgi:hypothetical protein
MGGLKGTPTELNCAYCDALYLGTTILCTTHEKVYAIFHKLDTRLTMQMWADLRKQGLLQKPLSGQPTELPDMIKKALDIAEQEGQL